MRKHFQSFPATASTARGVLAGLLAAGALSGSGLAFAAQAGNPAAPAPPPAAPTPPPGEAPGPGETFSLDEAVRYALEHNPRIGGAAAQVRQARARVGQRRAERGPQLNTSNFVIRQGPTVPPFRPGDNPAVPAYRWDLGVFLNQVVFDWGRRSARQRAAERDVNAALFRTEETENDVRLVVGVSFYNVLRSQQLLAVAQERRESAQEQLRVAQARFESDVSPRFDVIRAEAELANAEQEVIDAENEIALAESTLNTALGRPADAPIALELGTEPPVPPITFEQAREAALEERPQLAALRETVEGLRQEVRARRAENKPQIDFSAGYDRPNPGGFASTAYRWNLGLTLDFPFFDSGLTRNRVREAQGLVDETRQELELARQQVELDVRSALLDLREAERRIQTATQEQRAAREALRVANVRYQAGVGTNVEVTDAQVAVARAGQNLANATFDYEAARVRLEAATGQTVEELIAGMAVPAPPMPPPGSQGEQ
ncbi:MAG: TolC family protein [Armatimonadota bacterium]